MSVCVGVHAKASATSGKEATRPRVVVVGTDTDDAAMQVPGEGAATQGIVVSRVSPMASTLQLQQVQLKLRGCAISPTKIPPHTIIHFNTALPAL